MPFLGAVRGVGRGNGSGTARFPGQRFFSQSFLSCSLQDNPAHCPFMCAPGQVSSRGQAVSRCRGYDRSTKPHGSFHHGVHVLVGERGQSHSSVIKRKERVLGAARGLAGRGWGVGWVLEDLRDG